MGDGDSVKNFLQNIRAQTSLPDLQGPPESNRDKTKKHPDFYFKKLSGKIDILPQEAKETEKSRTEKKKDGKKKEKKPLKYCVFITNYPIIAYLLALSFHVGVLLTTGTLVAIGYNLFPLDFVTLLLVLHNEDVRSHDLAFRDRNTFLYRVRRPVTGIPQPSWYNGQIGETLEVILDSHGGNIFSKENLNLLSYVEDRMNNLQYYQTLYCLINSNNVCEKPSSILRLFDGTYNATSSVFVDPSFDNINNVLCNATLYNDTKSYVKLFIEKDLNLCDKSLHSDKTRMFVHFGWPLRGDDDSAILEKYLTGNVKSELESLRDGVLASSMQLYYTSEILFKHDVALQAIQTLMQAIGSFAFIFVFMWIQTASFWVTFMGIFSIITSFLLTNLIYRIVLGYEYFGFFHIISIFIILGIGADDVFIFYDTWRLTGHTEYPSNAHRLSDYYRKAAKTTFVTSLTTMAAFFVSGFSPFLPVASFGLFSGILVFVNYLCDLLYFPTVIMVYAIRIKPKWDSIFGSCKSKNKSKDERKPIHNGFMKRSVCAACCHGSHGGITDCSNDPYLVNGSFRTEASLRPSSSELTESSSSSEDKDNTKKKENVDDRNKIVLFFKNGFFDVMTLRAVRICVPLAFLIVSAGFMYSASNLEPDANQLQIYKESHNYGKANRMHYYSFEKNFESEYTSVYLVWGLKDKDMSTCNLKSSENCRGTSALDDNFNISTTEAQNAFLDLCQRLEGMSSEEAELLRVKRNSDTNKLEISCFTTALNDFMAADIQASNTYPASLNLTMPFDAGNVTTFMQSNSHIYDMSSLPASFDRYLETMISYWLLNKYTIDPTPDFWLYEGLLGEQYETGYTQRALNRNWLYYATKLKYAAIEINTTLSVYTLGYPEGKPVYERWQNLMNEELAKMPEPLKNGFQCTRDTWHWIKVQEVLLNSAVLGVFIGLGVALPILIFTTMNVVIGFLVTVVIGLVTTCVIGIIPLAGWKLGVIESLNLCMVVGLSVDYVVHLAEAYSTSPAVNRLDRVRCMLESMGLSVISGAITTMGASTFLLFTQIQFLFQFGIFVLSTIAISMVFSIFGFTTLMALCGPQGNTGDLKCLWKKIKSYLQRPKQKPETDQNIKSETPTMVPNRERLSRTGIAPLGTYLSRK